MLVALDVDGTLLRSDNTVSSRTADAIRAASGAGWQVILATGKPPWAIRDLVGRLSLAGPHIVANGSATWCPPDTLDVVGRIDPEDVRAALAFGAQAQIPRATSGPSGVFCEPGWAPRAVADALAEVGEDPPTLVADALETEPDAWKVILIAREGSSHPEPPCLRSARWVRTHRNFLEALPRWATKGSTLQGLCQRLGFERDQVVAFGDGENDVEMLAWAGHGVAMANAPTAVRASAATTTATNDRDGVAIEIERLLKRRGPVPSARPAPSDPGRRG